MKNVGVASLENYIFGRPQEKRHYAIRKKIYVQTSLCVRVRVHVLHCTVYDTRMSTYKVDGEWEVIGAQPGQVMVFTHIP